MAAKTYRIRMVRGDEQFEAEGDRAFVTAMLKRFEESGLATASRSAAKTAPATPAKVASSKAVSIGEFIRKFGFKKHTDLVLAFGYYLEQHTGLQSFSAADISKCYYEAKMETSNVSQSIIQNIKRGYIMPAKGAKEDKGRKNFTLTSSGEAHLNTIAETPHDSE